MGPEALSMAEVAERIAHAVGDEIPYMDIAPERYRQALEQAGAASTWIHVSNWRPMRYSECVPRHSPSSLRGMSQRSEAQGGGSVLRECSNMDRNDILSPTSENAQEAI
jgi:uncharacterized protein YbjT (DUF2867 family)